MAETAHKTADAKLEYFDPPEVLERKVRQLADWLRESEETLGFTGGAWAARAAPQPYRSA